MKKVIVTTIAALLFSGITVWAQAPLNTQTTILVTIKVEKQTVKTGIYARFAQKFFGVVAPLADKQTYTILSAELGNFSDSDMPSIKGQAAYSPLSNIVTPLQAVSHTRNTTDFVKLPIDRHDMTERSLEEAAKEAANTIFSIRKHRIELVCGTAGENVFGEGLAVALTELERLEQEYLSLFMGKQSVQQIIKSYRIQPEKGDVNRIVCRFSPQAGLLSDTDLSGSPIVLEMKLVSQTKPLVVAPEKPSKNTPAPVSQLFPATVTCRLIDGKEELASQAVSIYQMGAVYEIPAAAQ